MQGPAGVLSVVARGAAWLRRAAAQLEMRRRNSRARRLARQVEREQRRSLSRTWVEAEISARLAVRSGVRLEDFLRARVARYAAMLPVPLDELGVDVSIEGGDPIIRLRGSRSAAEAASPVTPSPACYLAEEIRGASAQLAATADRVGAARARVDALAHAVAEDLASGRLPAAPGQVDASLEQCGRPPVPHPAPHLLLRSLSLALLASAAYRMAGPALAVSGLSSEDLGGAVARDPIATVAGILFGLGAAVSVYAFLNVAVQRGSELLGAASAERRPAVLGAAGGAAVALSAAVTLAAIRPGLMAGPLLLVCVPLATVLLLRQAARLEALRAQAAAAALEWDRVRAREAGERARRGEGVAAAEAALATAVQEQAAAERRLRALEKRSIDEAREAELVAAESARGLERLAEALAAALELDRYAFVRRAAILARDGAPVRQLRARPAPVEPGGRFEAAG